MQNLSSYFRELEEKSFSGEVEVSSSQGNAIFTFHQGRLILAHRPLGRSLERWQKIPWLKAPALEILTMVKTWEELVSRLLDQNPHQYSRVVQMLKTERSEVFFRAFFWSNIDVNARAYEVAMLDPVRFAFYAPKSLGSLLTEVKKRLKEWPNLQNRIGSSKQVFVSQVSITREIPAMDAIDESLLRFEQEQGQGTELFVKDVPYSVAEMEVISLCNGQNTVQDIVRLSTDGEFLTVRRLVNLWDRNLVRPKDQEDSVSFRHHIPTPHMTLAQSLLYSTWALVMILWLVAVKPPSPQFPLNLQPTQSAIEIHRMVHGRYPLTLGEVGQTDAGMEYSLIHSQEYLLKRVDRIHP